MSDDAVELARHSLHGLDRAGDKRCLHLADRIVDGDTGTFVQDLDAEDLRGCHGAVLIGSGKRDVEGKDLVAVPRGGQFLGGSYFVDLDVR
jgi:hypothetical protein